MEDKKLLYAYLAGILDGEGCITIFHEKKFKTTYILSVVVAMRCPTVVKLFASEFGGSLCLRGSGVLAWTIRSNKAMHMLRQLLPYLVVKKKQAEVGIAFQSNKKNLRFKSQAEVNRIVLERHTARATIQQLNAEWCSLVKTDIGLPYLVDTQDVANY